VEQEQNQIQIWGEEAQKNQKKKKKNKEQRPSVGNMARIEEGVEMLNRKKQTNTKEEGEKQIKKG